MANPTQTLSIVNSGVRAGAALALLAAPLVFSPAAAAAPLDLEKPSFAAPVGQKGPATNTPDTPSADPFATVPGGNVGGLVFAEVDDLLRLAAEIGSARIERDDDGDSFIAGNIDGINYSLDVFNCDPDCADLALTASFEVSGATNALMNDWNSTRRFGKAYIRDDGDAVLQLAINTRYGITVETFRDDLEWWKVVLEDYVSFVGFR